MVILYRTRLIDLSFFLSLHIDYINLSLQIDFFFQVILK